MASKQKILIVDDDNNIAELISLYLTKECYDTKIVNDGEEAVREFHSFQPNLILLDLMLPGMDGFEVCKKIREEKNIPILMVSAKKDDIDKIRGLGLGADDYMTKPFSPSELVARVKAHMARYERLVGTNQKQQNDIVEIRGIKIDKEQCDVLCDEIRRVKEGGKMADVKPEVKALCEELSGFKYEDCFAHNNVGFQDGSVTPAE